jgi:hypothetical protein
MDVTAIQSVVGVIPGGGIAALAIWFALRKDAQCTALMQQLTDIAKGVAVSNQQVVTSIDGLRDAIKQGTRA